MLDLHSHYKALLKKYGCQGWWPLLDLHDAEGLNPAKSGSAKGYHPKDYSYPKCEAQQFEICIGAILAQNTAWPNAEKALLRLKQARALKLNKVLSITHEELAGLIRHAGYFNQKARKLKEFAKFYLSLDNKVPARHDLLLVWGVGPETADSILLYAYKQPFFVVDAYTRKYLAKNKIRHSQSYDDIRLLFEKELPRDYRI
jgi:endonuclease III related protein